ncbi:MAG: NAD(P)H dehydrogenase assembly family protein [Nitrososphaeraceae archaeon]
MLSEPQPYLKTADAMPMLRPGDLVSAGEEGDENSFLFVIG